jgi:transposase
MGAGPGPGPGPAPLTREDGGQAARCSGGSAGTREAAGVADLGSDGEAEHPADPRRSHQQRYVRMAGAEPTQCGLAVVDLAVDGVHQPQRGDHVSGPGLGQLEPVEQRPATPNRSGTGHGAEGELAWNRSPTRCSDAPGAAASAPAPAHPGSRRGPRRRRPGRLHADKGYDDPHLRAWLRSRRITPRIARRGIETGERLGRHRWVVERSFAWLTGYRRLTIRYERRARLFTAFLTLAATLTCYKKLTT